MINSGLLKREIVCSTFMDISTIDESLPRHRKGEDISIAILARLPGLNSPTGEYMHTSPLNDRCM
jgi:hypothetical protein